MSWHLCRACSQANRHPQVSRAHFVPYTSSDSQGPTWHLHPVMLSRCSPLPSGRGGLVNRTEGWPIKYLSVCWAVCRVFGPGKYIMSGSMQKLHSMGKKRKLFWTEQQNSLFLTRQTCLKFSPILLAGEKCIVDCSWMLLTQRKWNNFALINFEKNTIKVPQTYLTVITVPNPIYCWASRHLSKGLTV